MAGVWEPQPNPYRQATPPLKIPSPGKARDLDLGLGGNLAHRKPNIAFIEPLGRGIFSKVSILEVQFLS